MVEKRDDWERDQKKGQKGVIQRIPIKIASRTLPGPSQDPILDSFLMVFGSGMFLPTDGQTAGFWKKIVDDDFF